MSNELTHAYLAGAIDHDGFISIQRSEKANMRSVYYSVKIGYTQSRDNQVADLLESLYGGGVYTYERDESKHTLYQWYCQSKKAKKFIIDVLPYLVIKKRQAEVALRFIAIKERQYKTMLNEQKPPYRVTDSMEKEREELWAIAATLNGSCKLRKRNRELAESILARIGKKRAGRLLDGREWNEMPRRRIVLQ